MRRRHTWKENLASALIGCVIGALAGTGKPGRIFLHLII